MSARCPDRIVPRAGGIRRVVQSGRRGRRATPAWRRLVLDLGALIALTVYYLNYGADFDQGLIQNGSPLSLPLRVAAVAAIVLASVPLRSRSRTLSVTVCGAWYLGGAVSMAIASLDYGGLNDVLFLNTLLQVPILFSLAFSSRPVDFARWLRFISTLLAAQVLLDACLRLAGYSLWRSDAFVGGVGNPSSFGFLCLVAFAFCLLHPEAGRLRMPLAILLGVGAVMSASLFAALGLAGTLMAWLVLNWRRMAVRGACLAALTVFLVQLAPEDEKGRALRTVEHKIASAGAVAGVAEYDREPSGTVTMRIDIHARTFAGLAADAGALVGGHLEGLPYWPMDSQVLTYLGSFGLPATAVFVGLHAYWLLQAWRRRRTDGGFTVVVLGATSVIFATNRILDYYPVATVYFLVVAMNLHGSPSVRLTAPATAEKPESWGGIPQRSLPWGASRSGPRGLSSMGR